MKAQDIKTGDTFFRDGKLIWTAKTDAIEYWMSDEKLARVIIETAFDGGIDARYFNWDTEVRITRA